MPERKMYIQRTTDNSKSEEDSSLAIESKIGQYNSDTEVWCAFKKGGRIAYQLIYDKHADFLYDYGFKITSHHELVEDCIQELFVDLWVKKSKLGNVSDIKAYLLISFRRRLFELVKKNKRSISLVSGDNFEIYLNFPDERVLINDEIRDTVLKEINNLSKQKKEAIYLRFYNDLTCTEVADIMGIKTQSVYNLISTGLNLIKKAFKNESE